MQTKTQPKNSKWRKGGLRYDAKTQELIDHKYHEAFGWHQGARISVPRPKARQQRKAA